MLAWTVPSRRKTWTEKLDNGRKAEVVRIARSYAGLPAGSDVLIPTPREVQAAVRKIPAGKFVAPEQLRAKPASKHGVETACPLVTGIFLRIIGEAAWEQMQAGADPEEITPFWRVVAADSTLAKKLSCGPSFVRKMQRAEGIAA